MKGNISPSKRRFARKHAERSEPEVRRRIDTESTDRFMQVNNRLTDGFYSRLNEVGPYVTRFAHDGRLASCLAPPFGTELARQSDRRTADAPRRVCRPEDSRVGPEHLTLASRPGGARLETGRTRRACGCEVPPYRTENRVQQRPVGRIRDERNGPGFDFVSRQPDTPPPAVRNTSNSATKLGQRRGGGYTPFRTTKTGFPTWYAKA